MKPIDLNGHTSIDSNKKVNVKDPKFYFGDYVRVSKYKNTFEKKYTPNQSEEVFVTKKIKNAVPQTCY